MRRLRDERDEAIEDARQLRDQIEGAKTPLPPAWMLTPLEEEIARAALRPIGVDKAAFVSSGAFSGTETTFNRLQWSMRRKLAAHGVEIVSRAGRLMASAEARAHAGQMIANPDSVTPAPPTESAPTTIRRFYPTLARLIQTNPGASVSHLVKGLRRKGVRTDLSIAQLTRLVSDWVEADKGRGRGAGD